MKHMKRLNKMLSLLLAIAMLLSMAVAVEAASTNDCSIKVTNASDGETYYAYKIFDAVVGGSNYSYTIDEESPFFEAINDATKSGEALENLLELKESVTEPGTYVVTYKGTTEENKTAFTTAMISIIKDVLETTTPTITPDGTGTVDTGESTVIISDLYAGYYYVSTTVGTVVSLGTTSGSQAEIEDKNEEPYVSKTVYDGTETDETQILNDTNNWDDANDAGVGDTVYFTTKIYHLADIETLVLHDTMDTGLDFDDIVSVKLYSGPSDVDPEELIADDDYTITVKGTGSAPSDDCTFEINFANLLDSNTKYSDKVTGASNPDAAYIEVIYKATINSNAVIYSVDGNPNSNDNNTYVSFGNDSKSEKSTTKTYVYSLNIYKYTGESVEKGTALEDATFYIYKKDSNGTPYYAVLDLTSSPYTLQSWTTTEADATKITTTSTGLLQIEGLDEGTYYIHETEAPAGYNPLTADVEFYIAGEGETNMEQGAIYGSSTSGNTITESVTVQSVSYTAIPIKNSTGSELPGTGGIGTTIFYVVGGVLVVGAIVLLITKKRLGNKDDE
ncbi:MAG: SpaH/EbpB family LPXTG-anchored major pilin [Oscillospiraceae bacterium]|nr:SpaH/EbpB family LPXTG-anchored major pilin [Oscillospiraceae bacterium]